MGKLGSAILGVTIGVCASVCAGVFLRSEADQPRRACPPLLTEQGRKLIDQLNSYGKPDWAQDKGWELADLRGVRGHGWFICQTVSQEGGVSILCDHGKIVTDTFSPDDLKEIRRAVERLRGRLVRRIADKSLDGRLR